MLGVAIDRGNFDDIRGSHLRSPTNDYADGSHESANIGCACAGLGWFGTPDWRAASWFPAVLAAKLFLFVLQCAIVAALGRKI